MKIQRKQIVKINTTDTSAWIDNEIEPNDGEEGKSTSNVGFCCLLRAIQIGFVLILLYASCVLVQTFLFTPALGSDAVPNPPLIQGIPHIQHVVRWDLEDPPPTTLLGIKNFTLFQEPERDLCKVENLLFLIVVHSKPDHFRQRQAIRSTWGSLKRFSDANEPQAWSTRTIFVLGESSESDKFQPSGIRPNVSDLVKDEGRRHGDILRGSFEDQYHNLRYKHILGLRYASKHCSNAVFFLKADDDAFVDLPGLYRYLVRTFGPLNKSLTNILAGNVFPSGTYPQREGKWAVKATEYPWSQYPSYLGGLAYLMTPDIARDLYKIAHTDSVPEIWVDDVWVTGLLAHTLGVQPLYLNPRYSYDHNEMREWIDRSRKNNTHLHHPPYTFAHLDPAQEDWKDLSRDLWNRVLLSYDLKTDNQPIGTKLKSNEIENIIR